jgi:hypothetical protein
MMARGGRRSVEVSGDGSVLVAVFGGFIVAATVRLLLLAIAIVVFCVVGVAAIGRSVGCGGGWSRAIGPGRRVSVGSWGGWSTVVSWDRGRGGSRARRGAVVGRSLGRHDV